MDSTNEGSDSITAEVRVHDILDPDSLSIYRGLSSGVTASLILHGSANAIGGQSAVVKMKWHHPVEELFVPDAPRMIKFALGENPKRSNRFPGETGSRFPGSRMGVEAVYRRAFNEARHYMKTWDAYDKAKATNPGLVPPRRDLRLEAIADILKGAIRVQCHSYRADEMLMMVRLSEEFHFRLVLQHGLEAYKIAPEIAAAGVGVSTFAADWAYKVEANDAIAYNAALCLRAGIVTSVNSDNGAGTYRLNLEAAKCVKYGGLTETEALSLITINPAIQLGIEKRAGSLEAGKDADIAIWQGHPLTNYSKCVMTLVEGEVYFQRRDAFHIDGVSTIQNTFTPASIDPLTLPMPKPSSIYAIVGGTVHPMDGPNLSDGTVVISDGKILAVGRNLAIPRGAVIVSAKGKHVYPGLIDAGSQLGLNEIGSIEGTKDSAEGGAFQPDLIALRAIHAESEHLPTTRITGITTTQSVPDGGGGGFGAIFGGGSPTLIAGQSSVIDLAGWTAEQMEVRSPVALQVYYPETISEETLDDIRDFLPPGAEERLKGQAEEGVTKFKTFFAQAKQYAAARSGAGENVPIDPKLEAMQPYLAGTKPVIFHANSLKGIRDAIKFAEDNKLKMILAGGGEAWRIADTLAAKKIPLIYSVPLSDSLGDLSLKNYDPYDAPLAAVSVLLKAGVKLAFQSESYDSARNLPAQVGLLCAYGTPHDAVLRSMTLGAAEILGISDIVGSLTPGKRANLLVTDGDPLEITTNVERLFIAGKPVSLETKNTQLYELYRQRLREIKPTPRAAKLPKRTRRG